MDSQLEEKFRSLGHGDIYDRLLPKKLMNKSSDKIKSQLKKLSKDTDPTLNRVPLTKDQYIHYWRCAQVIKKKCARQSKEHARYVPWRLVKEKVKPIRSGSNKTHKNEYVRKAAEEYNKLRTEHWKNRFPEAVIKPASSSEINRLAGLLVGYNGTELEDEGDGTVGIGIEFESELVN